MCLYRNRAANGESRSSSRIETGNVSGVMGAARALLGFLTVDVTGAAGEGVIGGISLLTDWWLNGFSRAFFVFISSLSCSSMEVKYATTS